MKNESLNENKENRLPLFFVVLSGSTGFPRYEMDNEYGKAYERMKKAGLSYSGPLPHDEWLVDADENGMPVERILNLHLNGSVFEYNPHEYDESGMSI